MSLPLHAEYLLICTDATGHRLLDSVRFKAGLAGAAIVELALQEALVLEGTGRRARFRATGADIDPSLAEALERADGRSPRDAVDRLGGSRSLRDRAGDLADATFTELERLEAVTRVEGKTLGIFPTTRWVERNPEPRREIVERLSAAIGSPDLPDRRTASLISIAYGVGVLTKVVRDHDKSSVRAHGKRISAEDWGGDAVAQAIKQVESATIVAIAASTTATFSGTN
jgi:hypothetical protein